MLLVAGVSNCPRCVAHLVLHLADKRLRCHHCGYESRCPKPARPAQPGYPTPSGEAPNGLRLRWPNVFRSAHLALWTASSRCRKQEALCEQIHAGEADIPVGTQMLAKGHDFPAPLVGALGADAALFAADCQKGCSPN